MLGKDDVVRWMAKDGQGAACLHALLHFTQESEGGATYFLAEDASGFTGAAILTDSMAPQLQPPQHVREVLKAAANLDKLQLFKDATSKELRACCEVGWDWG